MMLPPAEAIQTDTPEPVVTLTEIVGAVVVIGALAWGCWKWVSVFTGDG